jgi:peptidylprolyl isomerase
MRRSPRALAIGCAQLLLLQGAGCEDAASSAGEAAATEQATSKTATSVNPASDPPMPPASGAGEAEAEDVAAPSDLTTPPADAEKTASGLVTKVLEAGTGDRTPTLHDTVRVHYTGWKASGKVIDTSRARGRGPATFQLRGVIAGWSEGLQQMRVGEQRRLWIPDHLSYVRPGPPRGTVVFDIELLEIIEGEARPAPKDVRAPPGDAKRSKSGLVYEVLQAGSGGASPNAWDRVTLRYAGWTPRGEMFEASPEATFEVDHVMPGWREALQRMTSGERTRLWVPEALAYQGRSGLPKGRVVFDLELLSIERRPAPPRGPGRPHAGCSDSGARSSPRANDRSFVPNNPRGSRAQRQSIP